MRLLKSEPAMKEEQPRNENVKMRDPEIWADDELNVHSEKRANNRIPSNLQARILYGNLIYTGRIKNLSENGMFIRTKVNFPVNSVFLLLVLVNEYVMKVPIKVKRIVRPENSISKRTDQGMGVELVMVSNDYLDYVKSCKAAA